MLGWRVASFGTNVNDLKIIYVLFIRSQLEQSVVVWHSSLTEQNKSDLERVQKSALKVILGLKYEKYKKALNDLDLVTLEERREILCLKFARKCTENEKAKSIFPLKNKIHMMSARKEDIYEVQHANTDRLKNFAVIYMQNLLNKS